MKVRFMEKSWVTTIIGICLFSGAVITWIVRGRCINKQIDEFDQTMHNWKN